MFSPSASLLRSTPEAQGISSDAIQRFLDAIADHNLEFHSLMVLRHGTVITEGWWAPYSADKQHVMYSLSKSFTSTAAGFAVQEGFFKLDAPVLSFFPEDAPATPSEYLKTMRVRDLLTMTSGHAEDTLGPMFSSEDGNWGRAFLALPVEHEPGTHFVYNSGATYMVSAIVQKTTGQNLTDFLQPRLFAPLGIIDPIWQSCPKGINTGGWGLNLRTEDIARFGQFYLQKGVWNGEQLLNANWIAEATSSLVPNGEGRDTDGDWAQGYGFQFWRCHHNAYRGDGAFGQYCVVMPEQQMVVAITSYVDVMQDVLNAIWNHLLPACSDAPLVENTETNTQLRERLENLHIAFPIGSPHSPIAEQFSGRHYELEPNERGFKTITFEFTDETYNFTVEDEQGSHRFSCGTHDWYSQDTQFLQRAVWLETPRSDVWRLTAKGNWVAPDALVVKLCFDETPFTPLLTCRFTEDKLALDLVGRIGFRTVDLSGIKGHLA